MPNNIIINLKINININLLMIIIMNIHNLHIKP